MSYAPGFTIRQMSEGGLVVRATKNLPGLRAGEYELVDPDEPWIATLLSRGHLVPDEDDEEEGS